MACGNMLVWMRLCKGLRLLYGPACWRYRMKCLAPARQQYCLHYAFTSPHLTSCGTCKHVTLCWLMLVAVPYMLFAEVVYLLIVYTAHTKLPYGQGRDGRHVVRHQTAEYLACSAWLGNVCQSKRPPLYTTAHMFLQHSSNQPAIPC